MFHLDDKNTHHRQAPHPYEAHVKFILVSVLHFSNRIQNTVRLDPRYNDYIKVYQYTLSVSSHSTSYFMLCSWQVSADFKVFHLFWINTEWLPSVSLD